MTNTVLKFEDIRGVDIEMSCVCNLRCPLCLSRLDQTKDKFVPHNVDIGKLIQILDRMPNLEVVSIAGDASEPTLHPGILGFLDYLKGRSKIFVEFYTNSSLHEEEFWTELNRHFNKNSMVQFTICGSTQELHSKYRVGSDLDVVLRNALAFKRGNPFRNDNMQYIKFEYNRNDDKKRINEIFGMFSDSGFINTDPICERLTDEFPEDGICSDKVFRFMYAKMLEKIRRKRRRDIQCYSLDRRYVRIDNFLNISPCVCYRLHFNEDFGRDGKLDYGRILNDEYEFCYECDVEMRKFMQKTDRDVFYMC